MPGLIIKFSLSLVNLPCYLSAKGPSKCITIEGMIDEIPTKIQLVSDKSSGVTNPEGTESKFFFNNAVIEITDRNEDLKNCEFIAVRARYLLMSYQKIVVEALNRLILYFKYELRNPLMRGISHYDFLKEEHAFYNPEWFTLAGERIEFQSSPFNSGIISFPGIAFLQDDFFGIKQFTEDNTSALQEHVFSNKKYDLTDELLSDAQASALQHQLRRSVLELAITIEVFVKNMFFKRERIAGSAFEYLEDKGKESIRVLDLLDGASVYAFGESFKKHSPATYKDIDHIVRCRNKIAHRGEAKYRDDSGWHEVDFEKLRLWWKSTLEMISWLESRIKDSDARL
jgi:hypothetical protein